MASSGEFQNESEFWTELIHDIYGEDPETRAKTVDEKKGVVGKPYKSRFTIAKPGSKSPVIGSWGSILFRRSSLLSSSTSWECLLVTSRKGHVGFPKGKRKSDETARQTAIRETLKLTGLSELDWTLTGSILTEIHDTKSKPSVIGYFVGFVHAPQEEKQDSRYATQWATIDGAKKLAHFLPNKQQLLARALKHLVC